ncbi:MAG: ribonuclease P protein component [Bdellovibrionaceae bacterium]|nr:ribonuclease P protein component [Pseudobdellovibrionaceae bacterium]
MGNKQQLETLKSRSDFQKLYEKGQRVYPSHWMIVNVCKNNQDQVRCGWTLARYVGTAVTRNRLKRWCREFLRKKLASTNVRPMDINIVFKRKDKEFYKNLNHDEFNKTIDRFFKKLDK